MPPEPTKEDRLKRAREALAGPGRLIRDIRPKKISPASDITPPLNLPPEELKRRREVARAGLEGYERRKRREVKEAAIRAAQLAQEKLAADIAAKRRAAQEAEAAKAKMAADQAAAQAAADKRRREQIKQSEKMIEKLKSDPNLTLKAIRTYKEDLAAGVRATDTAQSLAAHSRELLSQYADQHPPTPTKRYLIIGITILIIGTLGISLATWFYLNRPLATQETPAPVVDAMLATESQKELYLTGKSPLTLRDEIYQARLQSVSSFTVPRAGGGPLLNLFPTAALKLDSRTGKAESKTQVGLSRYLAALDLALPLTFRLALNDDFMVGIYQAPRPALFYLFKVNSYEQAGRALASEGSQIADILFSPLVDDPNFSRTIRDQDFRPLVIDNVDTVVLKNEGGETIMLYAFLDKETLLFTESEEAFKKLLGLYRTPLPVTR